MEKSQRKTRKGIIVVFFIFFIIFIIISSYLTINNINKINKINSERKLIRKELKPLRKEYKSIKENKDTVKQEVDKLKDIDNDIISIKEEVFNLAKKVEGKIQNKETDAKIAYLTFDDGPYYLTDSVLNILREKQVKATFFTIGAGKDTCFDKKSVSCKETYKRIVDNNHTIANHTYSHSIFSGLYSNLDNFSYQVKKQEELIYDRTGIKTNILRFPGGSVTAGRLKDSISNWLKENNYGWVDWTSEDGDGRDLKSKEQAWSLLKSSIDEDIEVILLHDYNDITYSILPDIIDYLEGEGYILLPLFYDSVMVNK